MSKIFSFNDKRNGSYVNSVDGSVGINTNGEWAKTEKGLAWRGNGVDSDLEFATNVLSLSLGYSIEAWGKTSGDGIGHMFSSDSQTDNERAFQLRFDATGEIRFITFDQSNAVINNHATANKYNNGEWHHVIAIFDPSTGSKLYVDGVLDGSDATIGTSNDVDSFILLGATYVSGNPDQFLNGNVCKSVLYDHILPPPRKG